MTKVDIISGFLGAGKTTLIKKLLNEKLNAENVVLIENEFGEIGIDGDFLKETNIEIKEINAGCICCSLQGDFEEALEKVIEAYHPGRIIIEPSGVGKLSDVTKAVKTVEDIHINSLVTVVDAKKCKIYSKNFKEFFNDQIASATCVILSKTNNLSDEKLKEAHDIVKEINPKARIITTNWDEIDADTIIKVMEQSMSLMDFVDMHDEHHHHHHHHDHDECDDPDCECHHHHHDEDEECDCHHEHHHHHDHEECDDPECECHHHHDEDEECDCHHEHHHHDHEECDDPDCECHHDHHGHHHHHHHADEVFTSIGLETINKYTKEELEEILSKLDENILRAKGIVKSNDGWLFFDYVPGDIDVREGSASYTGLITVIGSKVDEAQIKELFRL